MADSEGGDTDELRKKEVFSHLDDTVTHILWNIGCKPKQEIAEQLEVDISVELLKETRDTSFGLALDKYCYQLKTHNIDGKPDIELKLRRGGDSSVAYLYATDIIELVLYICGLVQHFPRDVISGAKKGQYIDICMEDGTKAKYTKGKNEDQISSQQIRDCKCKEKVKTCEETLSNLFIKYENCEKSLRTLREHVLSLEKSSWR